jgi:cytochrome P450
MAAIAYDDEFFADPHRTYAELRAKGPAVPLRDPNGLDYWLVTRYREARVALAEPSLSKDPRHAWARLREAGMVSGDAQDATVSMLTADPPDHARLRTPVSAAFGPARVDRLRPHIQQVADQLLDEVAGQGTVDLLDAVAFPLTVTVLCELLGVPADERDDFRLWTTAAHTPTYITGTPMPRQEGSRRLRAYIADVITRRKARVPAGQAARGDDLISALAAGPEHGLTGKELVETISHLLLAGQDATTNLIGNGVAALLRHRDQLELLRQRPELIGRAVEELMRYDGPTARSTPRVAVQDIELGGVPIPSRGIVIVGLSAANRDPARFDKPDQLDITRIDTGHLALGHGAHFCVAAPLARATAQIAIGTLLRRFPHITLACRPHELTWRPTPVFRGLTRLPVTVSAAG